MSVLKRNHLIKANQPDMSGTTFFLGTETFLFSGTPIDFKKNGFEYSNPFFLNPHRRIRISKRIRIFESFLGIKKIRIFKSNPFLGI